jgi:hypothetical protein
MAEIVQLGSGVTERIQTSTETVTTSKTLTWWGDVWRRFSHQRVPVVGCQWSPPWSS